MNYKELINDDLYQELLENFDETVSLIDHILETGQIEELLRLAKFSMYPKDFIYVIEEADAEYIERLLARAKLCAKRHELWMQVRQLAHNKVD